MFAFLSVLLHIQPASPGLPPMYANLALEELACGYQFTEGPAWSPRGFWVFSDVPGNTMYRWDPRDSNISVFRSPSYYANGNVFDRRGTLYTAQHDRMVTFTPRAGGKAFRKRPEILGVLASTFDGRKLNSPNDIAIHDSGWAYFTDPQFGLIGFGPQEAPEEQPVRGVYRVSPERQIERVSGTIASPNGIGFSPEQDRLYVADYSNGAIYAFDVNARGEPRNQRVFAQVAPIDGAAAADGFAVDAQGRLLVAGTGGITVFGPDGDRLGLIAVPRSPSNVAIGGRRQNTLFVTAQDCVFIAALERRRAPRR